MLTVIARRVAASTIVCEFESEPEAREVGTLFGRHVIQSAAVQGNHGIIEDRVDRQSTKRTTVNVPYVVPRLERVQIDAAQLRHSHRIAYSQG